MTMTTSPHADALTPLDPAALRLFQSLRVDAVQAVSARFVAQHDSAYAHFGDRGREACREDLAFHLEFLRPVLEFGLLQSMVDYLRWLDDVLTARCIPTEHLALSLDWLAEFFTDHMQPAHAAPIRAALHASRDAFLASRDDPPPMPQPPAAWPEAADFERALLAGDQGAARAIVDRHLDAGHTLIDVELHVIQPALYRIGEQWQANTVSVAQEHLAVAIVHQVMTMGLLRSPPARPVGKRVLLACVETNAHALGLRMVADAFQLAGWDVQHLGADVPTRALLGHVVKVKPDLVGLSVSFPQQLPVVKAVIAGLGERLGDRRPALIVGGLAINRFPALAAVVGADASAADARGAVLGGSQLAVPVVSE